MEAEAICFTDKADKGVPTYRPNRSAGQQAVNVPHGKVRALGEQATATLKDWRLLRKPRCSIIRITPPPIHAVLTSHPTKSDTRVKTLSAIRIRT
ncbi:hypothetical protein GCM10014715_88630 [Streptomyces spiralis]|uniref:Transposase n=1 Tax=Streptomyces spiralis TaxID=66376 RepID=A0A919E7K4_9ACTN|nr:hypothetical protein GCM10014715_88630 [Streptomyces spiralis]